MDISGMDGTAGMQLWITFSFEINQIMLPRYPVPESVDGGPAVDAGMLFMTKIEFDSTDLLLF